MEKHLYQEHYDIQEKHWWFLAKKKIIMSLIEGYVKSTQPLNILDAGCGTGLMLNDLKDLGQVSGMDYSEDAVNFCKIKHGDNVRRGWFPDNVPFENEKFDIIVCLDVIEHIDDDEKSVQVLSKLLKKDGTMILTVPALMALWSKWDDLNEHKRRYNRKELEAVLSENGFIIEKLSYYNFLLFPIVYAIRTFNKYFNKSSRSSDTDMPSKPVNLVLEKIFSFERFLLKFVNLPIGVSLIAVAKKRY